MARTFLSFVASLATVAAILVGLGATPTAAQTETQAPTGGTLAVSGTAALGTKQYPEMQQAVQLLLGPKHDKEAAIKALEIAARTYPELPSAHVLMYQVLVRLNQQPAARLELEAAAHSNPSDPEPYLLLGNIAVQERRIAEAAMDFEKAQQLLARYRNYDRKAVLQRQTCNGLAQVAEAREDWVETEKQLRELLKLAPEDLLAQQRLARCLFWQGLAKEAYDVLKAAKQMDVANANANKTKEVFLTPEAIMGQYYSQFEAPRTENAEKWFRSALEHAPNDLATRQVVAVWALEHGMIPFAKEWAAALVSRWMRKPARARSKRIFRSPCGDPWTSITLREPSTEAARPSRRKRVRGMSGFSRGGFFPAEPEVEIRGVRGVGHSGICVWGQAHSRSLGFPGRPICGFESEQRVRFSVKKIAFSPVAATNPLWAVRVRSG